MNYILYSYYLIFKICFFNEQNIIQNMPHDAHPMGVLVSAMSALSVFHPDANPALKVPGI